MTAVTGDLLFNVQTPSMSVTLALLLSESLIKEEHVASKMSENLICAKFWNIFFGFLKAMTDITHLPTTP